MFFWENVQYDIKQLKMVLDFVNSHPPDEKFQLVYGRASHHKADCTCAEWKKWFMDRLNEKINTKGENEKAKQTWQIALHDILRTIMKIIKTFDYKGIELKIVSRKIPYLNSYITAREVIAPNEGVVPYTIGHRETLKNIIKNVINVLNDYDRHGYNVIDELTSNNKQKWIL